MILLFLCELSPYMKKIYYLLIIIVTIILYYPIFNAGYVWDDNLLFVEKVKLVNEPLSWRILTEPVLPDTTYFRPLIFLTMYIEFHLFGQNPISSHIINLLILIFNTYLVSAITYKILLIKKYKNEIFLSLLAGLIYVVNPILVEATAWISGRFDLLVTTFSLLGVYFFIQIQQNTWRNSLTISVCFLLALFSKELGIIFPVLLFFMYMFFNVSTEKGYLQNIKDFITDYYKLIFSIFLTFLLYLLLRIQAMGDIYHQALDSEYFKLAYLQEYLPIHSLFFYIKQFVLPFSELTPLLPYEHLNDNPYSVIFKILIIILVFFSLIWGLIKKNKYVWLIFSILLTISLVIYIVPITIANNVAHNRFMTLGAAYFAILVTVLPYQNFSKNLNKLAIVIIAIWLILSSLITKSIVPFWQTDFTLWKWTYTVQPDNTLARNSYLYGLYQFRQFDEIVRVIEEYSSKNPNGLTVSDQLIYVNTLISLNNPEALKYAAGVDLALPKFHLMYKDKSEYKFSGLSDAHVASFYGSYALASSVFENNPKKALELNNIAYWYLNEDEKVSYFFNDVAYLYQAGRVEESMNLYHYLEKLEAYGKEYYDYNMYNIIKMECLNRTLKNKVVCDAEISEFINTLK